eukprot:1309647-Amphidinium_carterae.1
MFLAILKGEFDPDASRSVLVARVMNGSCRSPDTGAASMAASPAEVEVHSGVDTVEGVKNPDKTSDTGSSSDVVTEASDQQWCEDLLADTSPEDDIESAYVLNARSGCLHRAEAGLTSCGLMCKGFDGFHDYLEAFSQCTNACAKCFRM